MPGAVFPRPMFTHANRDREKHRRRTVVPGSRMRHRNFRRFATLTHNYGGKMWGLFLALVIFGGSFETESGPNDEGNSTEVQYSVQSGDYMEVPSLRRAEFGHLDYYNFLPGVSIEAGNETGPKLIVNKCCGWHYYFDVETLTCRNHVGNKTDVLPQNESDYLFIEQMPDCGNRTVLTARFTSRITIGTTGVVIEGGVFPKYCVDGNFGHPFQAVVLSCDDPEKYCKTRTCFRKCCPLGHSYGSSGRKCQKSKGAFTPQFYDPKTLSRVRSPGPSEIGVYLGDACGTKGKYLLEKDLGEVGYLGIDGTLLFEKRPFSGDEFCLEFVEMGKESGVESFLCFAKAGTHFENSQLQFFLLSLGFIISCMFLLLTFLVYLFSPKSQNLYGKTLMCYIACLFSSYLCLAVIELKSKEINKSGCTYLGYSLLFWFLASFFWLNVMSFDIWKTFRVDRSVDRSKTDKGKLQFIWYSLYAWSLPSAITAVCAYVNQAQDFPFEAIKPDIGEENCWFSKKRKGIYVFFITPISLVITCNVIFYVQTAWKIWKVKSDVKKMDRQKTKKFSANKEQFLINGKLFVVMGITWSLEIISFFAPHPIWYVTDAANALHGVFIFAVFVLKKKVLHQVSEQVRAPLKKMRQLTSSDSDDFSRRKNILDLNTEGRTFASGDPSNGESKK